MKKPSLLLAAFVVVYACICMWRLDHRPPLEFAADLESSARISITEWYEATHDFPTETLDLSAVFYAIGHPRHPHRYRPSVSYGGLGGEGTIQVSYRNYVALFTEKDGRWEFLVDETA